MRRIALALSPLLYVLIHACRADENEAGSSTSGDTVEDAIGSAFGSGGGDGLRCSDRRPEQEDQYDQFYAEMAELLCRRQFECCTANERGAFAAATLEECVADPPIDIEGLTSENQNSLECSRILFQPDVAAACLAQLRDGSCADVESMQDCIGDRGTRIWRPTSAIGEACEGYSIDCLEGYCESDGQLQGDGRCTALKPIGAPCVWDKECASGNCDLVDTDACAAAERDVDFCRRP